MVWYPSVETVVRANKRALRESEDQHPFKLIRSREAVRSVIGHVRSLSGVDVVTQATHLMIELIRLHPFGGANHRTAYLVTKMFLESNDVRLSLESFNDAYSFIGDVENRTVDEVREWIRHGSKASTG